MKRKYLFVHGGSRTDHVTGGMVLMARMAAGVESLKPESAAIIRSNTLNPMAYYGIGSMVEQRVFKSMYGGQKLMLAFWLDFVPSGSFLVLCASRPILLGSLPESWTPGLHGI